MALEKKITSLISGDGGPIHFLMLERWRIDLLAAGQPVPEGHAVINGTRTYRVGVHVVGSQVYRLDGRTATEADWRRALETEMAKVIAAYPATLQAELEDLRKRAAARGITLPDTPTSSPTDTAAGEAQEND